MLLALDPSSTCTGYARYDAAGKLVDAGKLVPVGKTWLQRFRSLAVDLDALLAETGPDRIVIEVSTSKYGTARSRGAFTAGVYHAAWGYLLKACDDSGCQVSEVEANEWTKGWSKSSRAVAAGARYCQYDPAKDRGGDVADAICLGEWFLRRRSK